MHRHEIFYISNKSPKAKYIDTQIKLFIIYYDNKSAVLKFTVIDDSVWTDFSHVLILSPSFFWLTSRASFSSWWKNKKTN